MNTKLDAIAEEFQMVDPPMRLELLLEYAQKLPPLPEAYRGLRDQGLHMVHECQAPVFLAVDVEDGRVRLHADVPEEAPTARSFTAIMVEAFDGEDPDVVYAAPSDVLYRLGIAKLLGMQRMHGLSAIYHRIKREVARQVEAGQDAPGT